MPLGKYQRLYRGQLPAGHKMRRGEDAESERAFKESRLRFQDALALANLDLRQQGLQSQQAQFAARMAGADQGRELEQERHQESLGLRRDALQQSGQHQEQSLGLRREALRQSGQHQEQTLGLRRDALEQSGQQHQDVMQQREADRQLRTQTAAFRAYNETLTRMDRKRSEKTRLAQQQEQYDKTYEQRDRSQESLDNYRQAQMARAILSDLNDRKDRRHKAEETRRAGRSAINSRIEMHFNRFLDQMGRDARDNDPLLDLAGVSGPGSWVPNQRTIDELGGELRGTIRGSLSTLRSSGNMQQREQAAQALQEAYREIELRAREAARRRAEETVGLVVPPSSDWVGGNMKYGDDEGGDESGLGDNGLDMTTDDFSEMLNWANEGTGWAQRFLEGLGIRGRNAKRTSAPQD
jgi:hypothetical protein